MTKEIKQSVQELSAKITDALTMNEDTGATTAADNVYFDNAPEGVTPESTKKHSDYDTDFVSASTHAFGSMSIRAMASNKDLTNTQVSIPMGYKGAIDISATNVSTDDKVPVVSIIPVLSVRAGENGNQMKIDHISCHGSLFQP